MNVKKNFIMYYHSLWQWFEGTLFVFAVSSGALVGIIVAVVVVAVLAMLGCVLFLALCCYKRRLLLTQQMDISR